MDILPARQGVKIRRAVVVAQHEIEWDSCLLERPNESRKAVLHELPLTGDEGAVREALRKDVPADDDRARPAVQRLVHQLAILRLVAVQVRRIEHLERHRYPGNLKDRPQYKAVSQKVEWRLRYQSPDGQSAEMLRSSGMPARPHGYPTAMRPRNLRLLRGRWSMSLNISFTYQYTDDIHPWPAPAQPQERGD